MAVRGADGLFVHQLDEKWCPLFVDSAVDPAFTSRIRHPMVATQLQPSKLPREGQASLPTASRTER